MELFFLAILFILMMTIIPMMLYQKVYGAIRFQLIPKK